MKCEKFCLNLLIITFILMSICEARGGRRGGSAGGLFGSWRKYKKPSTGGGSSRRIVSSSPVHTPITKALHEKKSNGNDKFQKNLKANNYYNNFNTPPLPQGGAYYHNTASLPGNAIYIAQAPPRGSEFGDFLTGYLTGRLLTMGVSGPHYQVTHIHRETPRTTEEKPENSGSKFIIINRQQDSTTEKSANYTNFEADTLTTTDSYLSSSISSRFTTPSTVTDNPSPPYGVICMPLMVNETTLTGDAVQYERIVCYPAPAPPTPPMEITANPEEIAGDILEH